jgi:hypothetical protein
VKIIGFRHPAVECRTIHHDSGFLKPRMPESWHAAQAMLKISQSIRLTKSQDGGILLDVEHGAIFSLNPVGTRIIELLEEGQSLSSLVPQISREFGVSEEIAARDVDEFLSSLQQQRLLNEQDARHRPAQGEV